MFRNKKIVYIVIIALIILNVFAWIIVYKSNDSLLKVVFFDVGQGDSIFIEYPILPYSI